MRQNGGQRRVKERPCIGAVGEEFFEQREHPAQGGQQPDAAVAVRDAGGRDEPVQQQALRINEDVPLLALDQFASVKAVRINAGPPFSALFTL